MWWKVSKEEAAVECLVEGCHLAGIVSRVALLDVSGYKNILQIITITINIVLMIHSTRGESTTTTTTRSVRSSTARSGRRTRRPRRQRAGTSIVAIQQLFVKRSVDNKTLCQAYVALQEGSDNNLAWLLGARYILLFLWICPPSCNPVWLFVLALLSAFTLSILSKLIFSTLLIWLFFVRSYVLKLNFVFVYLHFHFLTKVSEMITCCNSTFELRLCHLRPLSFSQKPSWFSTFHFHSWTFSSVNFLQHTVIWALSKKIRLL